MNKLERGPQGDAAHKIPKLYIFQFQRRTILKMAVFVPMFQLATPRAGPVLNPWAHMNKLGSLRSTMRCYVPNIKALGLPASKKKSFEIFFLCSYVPTCENQGRASFDPRGIQRKTWKRSTTRCYRQNIKALQAIHP